jgi:hypothetical protein
MHCRGHLWCPDMSFVKPAVDSMVVLSFVESWNVLRKASSGLHGRAVCRVLKMSFVKPPVIGKHWGTTSRVAFLLKSQEIEFLIALTWFQIVVSGIGPRPCKILASKVSRKVSQRRFWNAMFGHIGDDVSKNRKKKYAGLHRGIQSQFISKFGSKLSLPCPFFCWTLWTSHCYYVYCS